MKEIKTSPLKVAIICGLIFGAVFQLFTGLGIFAGLGFGFFMWRFLKKLHKDHKEIPDELLNEKILAHGPANHFLNGEGRGGWLYLLESGLKFFPHDMNIQKTKINIPKSEIGKVIKHNFLGIIPNGIKVVKVNNEFDRFVVSNRSDWINLINESIKTN
jgi:hypothetical protein